MSPSPIVGTIVVAQQTPRGILARVDGQTRVFPDLQSVFRIAVQQLGEQAEPRTPQRKGETKDEPTTAPVGQPAR